MNDRDYEYQDVDKYDTSYINEEQLEDEENYKEVQRVLREFK
jgi:hypothetical protein